MICRSGATPVPIALSEVERFAFDADGVLGQITPRTRLIILNSPSAPNGGTLPKMQINRLVAALSCATSMENIARAVDRPADC